jgi:hypothetical protein
MNEKRFCAQISRERQDPFIGLAVQAELWLLVEYNGPWERSAVLNNQLATPVQEWLRTVYRGNTPSRAMVLFIRQHMRPLSTIRCFVAVTREARRAIYKFQYECYEDLLSLDLPALKAGASHYDQYRFNEPLFLICTNGKHDMCCAKFGLPVYNECARLVGEQAWHCTHVGGDKYAANMVCLPHGIYYSRVTVPETTTILAASADNSLYLEKFRGRTCYPSLVQAADYYLRRQTEIYDLDAFRLVEIQPEGELCWWIHFRSTRDDTSYYLTIQHEEAEGACDGPCHCSGAAKNIRHSFLLKGYAEQKLIAV